MGVYSVPLLTVGYGKEGERVPVGEIRVDFTRIAKNNPVKSLDCEGIIVAGKTTFDESIMAIGGDGSKIYGYFSVHKIEAWNNYFGIIFKQNDNVNELQAHFFCEDGDFPYIVKCERNGKACVKQGEVHSCLYTTLNYKGDLDPEEDDDYDHPFAFDINKYRENLYEHPRIFWFGMADVTNKVTSL